MTYCTGPVITYAVLCILIGLFERWSTRSRLEIVTVMTNYGWACNTESLLQFYC